MRTSSIDLTIWRVRVRIECADRLAFELIERNYASMLTAEPHLSSDLRYYISRDDSEFRLAGSPSGPRSATNVDDLLFVIDKAITVDLQLRRPDLLVLHGAALAYADRAHLLIGASGAGKSTTTWALLHHGFGYLSDELAPVDLREMAVLPYPHALCLKAAPSAPYAPPEGLGTSGHRLYLPTSTVPSWVESQPLPLQTVIFLDDFRISAQPRLRELSSAEAGTRAYANALNALAHPGRGLDATLSLASKITAYVLTPSDVASTCKAICGAVGPSVRC